MTLVTLLVVSLLGSAPLSDDDAAALLADDLKFAENLAINRFFDLANAVVTDINRDVQALDGDQVDLEGEASLIQARIHWRMSQNTGNDDERLAAQSKAIELLEDWARPGSSFAYLDRMIDALEDLATLHHERGKLYAKRSLQGESGAASEAEKDFKAAEKAYDDVQNEAEDRAEEYAEAGKADDANRMSLRALNTLYFRGLNSIEWSDIAADRELRLDQAIEQLDDFIWDVPDDQLTYYQAQYEQARAYHKMGELDDARDLLLTILDENSFGPAWGNVGNLNAVVQRGVVGVFNRVWGYLARLDAESGDLVAAEGWIQGMLDKHAAKGVPVGRDGLRVLLDWSEQLNGLGRTSDASTIIQYVVENGRGTPEGEQAERIFATVVNQGGSSLQLTTALFMDAAAGSASKGHWADAAYNYQRAVAAIETSDEREQFAYEAWLGAGGALRNAKRFLEAALCYEQALATVQELDLDLEELERAATRLYNSYDARFGETQDAFDKQLRDDASSRLLAIPGIELDLAFMKATETFSSVQDDDSAGFLASQDEFEAVPESSPNYERAQVYIARALEGAGRVEEALAVYERLEQRFTDPAHEPTNAGSRNKREIAMAQCHYYHATLLLSDAVGKPAEALALLEGYEGVVPGQESFHDVVKLRRVEALAGMGDHAGAEQSLLTLQDEAENAVYIAAGAFKVAQALETASRAARDAGESAEAKALLNRAADAMWIYAEASGFESYTNMLSTGEWYLEAGNPGRAQEVLNQTVQTFEGKLDDSQLDRARVALATAYDVQADFARARKIWVDLVDRNPTSLRIRTGAARSFGGWLEVDDSGQVIEIAGSGEYPRAHDLWVELYNTAKVNSKYHRVWWEAKLGAIYSWHRMSASDSQKGRNARKVLDQLRAITPEYDEGTIQNLEEQYRYSPLFKPLFRYLDKQLPVR